MVLSQSLSLSKLEQDPLTSQSTAKILFSEAAPIEPLVENYINVPHKYLLETADT